jgi:hypothetical protein
MGLFNRKNKGTEEPEEAPQVDIFTPQMLAKRLVWDIIPCGSVDEMIPLMNLVPDSPDVSDMEHKASHARLEQVLPLGEMLSLLVPLVSGITASAMLVNSGIPTDDETAVALQRQHSQVVRSGVVAILANLLDMGIIAYSDGVQIGE